MTDRSPQITVFIFTAIFGGLALAILGLESGFIAALLIFFALVCALNA